MLGDPSAHLADRRPTAVSPLEPGHGAEVGTPTPVLEQLESGREFPYLQEMGGVHARKSLEGWNEEPGILDEDVPRNVPDGRELSEDDLYEGLGLRLGEISAAPHRSYSERSQERAHFPELPGIGADERYVGHAYQGYSL